MKLTLYPHDINRSTAEFDGNPQFQEGIYERFKQLAMFLKAQDKGTAAAAAVAINQLADTFGCTVQFVGNTETGKYDLVVIESKREK